MSPVSRAYLEALAEQHRQPRRETIRTVSAAVHSAGPRTRVRRVVRFARGDAPACVTSTCLCGGSSFRAILLDALACIGTILIVMYAEILSVEDKLETAVFFSLYSFAFLNLSLRCTVMLAETIHRRIKMANAQQRVTPPTRGANASSPPSYQQATAPPEVSVVINDAFVESAKMRPDGNFAALLITLDENEASK